MTNTESDMSSVNIPQLLKKAVITFTSKQDVFSKNLEELKNLFNKLKASDVNLHPMFMKESTWSSKAKAPMTYVHIYENDIINVGIFILKPNMKLPLHNHPQMYGLLKVIAGTVKIHSYSLNTEKTLKYIPQESNSSLLTLIAEQMDDVTADPSSKCCVLTSNVGNIHEIESINGPAAFVDILSPPYDVDIPEVGERKCTYFKVVNELESKVFRLQEISMPSWFWSDSFQYTGPFFSD